MTDEPIEHPSESMSGEAQDGNAPVISDTPDGVESGPCLPFPVVGIGASAGGIEAYIDLFRHLPTDTGMAFVIVPHLSADQKSHLPAILSRQTTLPVLEIETNMALQPDHLYVLPPKARVRLEQGVFHLEDRVDGVPRPIDFFFRSLATGQKNRAVGVVLSGMDSDGALGLKAIKGEGGIAIVQSPESARFPDMPRSSISTDHVDFVLPPEEIAHQLARLGGQFRNPALKLLEDGQPLPDEDQPFGRVVDLLTNLSGIDFRLYKRSTLRRRVARRMVMQRIDTLADYAAFLQSNLKEVRDLREDALINVTRFFRDTEVFDTLKSVVLPRLFKDRKPAQQVRVWVAGCSSGEEVYSIAMCLLEFLAIKPFEPSIQIFGTDASEQSIQAARVGLYPETIVAEVSGERLRRFFVKTEKGYQVNKRVRDLCIFARQNLGSDPPFSRMDLISCRNVLIYFGAELQKQLIPTFHYALRPNGFLLLGSSETIREFTDLFALVDRKQKIYSKIGSATSRPPMEVVRRVVIQDPVPTAGYMRPPDTWGALDVQRAADRIVLSRYGPPGVIVNQRLEIVQSRGHTSLFFELPQGAATFQLARMARESIAPQVTSAVRRAIEEDRPIQVDGLKVREDDQTLDITLEVLPIPGVSSQSKYYLVLFAPAQGSAPGALAVPEVLPPVAGDDKDRLLAQLQHEVSSMRMHRQSLLEERDVKNQELLSANEEVQSSNEELQSTNEELETTKEELQSSNEELQTVNDELQHRNVVLTQASNDLSNLLNSVNLPVLMLSNDLTIGHFTPPAQPLLNVRPSDVGRPFGEIRMNLEIDNLEPLFTEVLDTLAPREIEVRGGDGRWYQLRVRPYRTADNKIEGLVVALVDIDQLRRSQDELREARDLAQSIIESNPLPLAVVDLDFKVRATNEAFCALAGVTRQELERRFFPDLAAVLWELEEPLGSHLADLRIAKKPGSTFAFEHEMPGENANVFCIRGCLLQPDGERFLLMTIEDISAHKKVERFLKLEGQRLASEVESTSRALRVSQNELRALTGSLFTSQEEERRRIARELHDDISQRLAALEIDSHGVERYLTSDPALAQRELDQVRAGLGALSEDVRRLAHRLHPSAIEDLGLAPALRSLTGQFGQREQMIATFAAQNVPDKLPLDAATSLYRIAQEALRNIAKHAGKTHVKVTLRGGMDGVQLQVDDFGVGFEMDGKRSGLGLISMQERARLMGATLTVESEVGRGTKVTVDVPAGVVSGVV